MKQTSTNRQKKYTPAPSELNNGLTLGEQASQPRKSSTPSASKLGLTITPSAAPVPATAKLGPLSQPGRRAQAHNSLWARMPGWNAPTLVLMSVVIVLGACIGVPIGAYLAVMGVDLSVFF